LNVMSLSVSLSVRLSLILCVCVCVCDSIKYAENTLIASCLSGELAEQPADASLARLGSI